MKGREWTSEETAMLREMRASGDEYKVIAVRLGRSLHAVKSQAYKMGLPTPSPWTPKAERALLALMHEGASMGKMLLAFPECSQQAIENKCSRLRKRLRK